MASTDFGAMWDQRDRFTDELRKGGLVPNRTLYIRRPDGGVCAVCLLGDGGVLTFVWENSACRHLATTAPRLLLESYEQAAVGFGGMFGMGKKGARGWSVRVLDGETVVWEAPVLPGITAIADLLYREDPFLRGRRRKDSIPLWRLRPEERESCVEILSVWQKLVNRA